MGVVGVAAGGAGDGAVGGEDAVVVGGASRRWRGVGGRVVYSEYIPFEAYRTRLFLWVSIIGVSHGSFGRSSYYILTN